MTVFGPRITRLLGSECLVNFVGRYGKTVRGSAHESACDES
jgi:hypothetical protein